MRGTAALRLDFEPSLLQVLNSSALKQLDRRLRDRIELERLRKETQNDLVELKDAMAWLVELFDRSAPDDLDPDWLTEIARQAQGKERQAEAQFRPVIAALKGALAPSDDKFEADVQKLFRDGIESRYGDSGVSVSPTSHPWLGEQSGQAGEVIGRHGEGELPADLGQ